MTKPIRTEVSLSSDELRRWHQDLEKWETAKAVAESHIADLRKRLDAAALLFGANLPLPVAVEGDAAAGEESMSEAAKRLLATLAKPVPHYWLQTELRKHARFRDMLDKNAGAYYYTMVARLVKRGEIKRVGKKIRLIHKNEALPEGNPESAP